MRDPIFDFKLGGHAVLNIIVRLCCCFWVSSRFWLWICFWLWFRSWFCFDVEFELYFYIWFWSCFDVSFDINFLWLCTRLANKSKMCPPRSQINLTFLAESQRKRIFFCDFHNDLMRFCAGRAERINVFSQHRKNLYIFYNFFGNRKKKYVFLRSELQIDDHFAKTSKT